MLRSPRGMPDRQMDKLYPECTIHPVTGCNMCFRMGRYRAGIRPGKRSLIMMPGHLWLGPKTQMVQLGCASNLMDSRDERRCDVLDDERPQGEALPVLMLFRQTAERFQLLITWILP